MWFPLGIVVKIVIHIVKSRNPRCQAALSVLNCHLDRLGRGIESSTWDGWSQSQKLAKWPVLKILESLCSNRFSHSFPFAICSCLLAASPSVFATAIPLFLHHHFYPGPLLIAPLFEKYVLWTKLFFFSCQVASLIFFFYILSFAN